MTYIRSQKATVSFSGNNKSKNFNVLKEKAFELTVEARNAEIQIVLSFKQPESSSKCLLTSQLELSNSSHHKKHQHREGTEADLVLKNFRIRDFSSMYVSWSLIEV